MGKSANNYNSVVLRYGVPPRSANAPNKEQQATTYLQQLMDESNNQIAVTPIKQNQSQWLSEVFVSWGEGEELASALLIMKGLAVVSQPSDCPDGDALLVAEELTGK